MHDVENQLFDGWGGIMMALQPPQHDLYEGRIDITSKLRVNLRSCAKVHLEAE